MARPSQVVVLVEDNRQQQFVFRYLRQMRTRTACDAVRTSIVRQRRAMGSRAIPSRSYRLSETEHPRRNEVNRRH